MQFSVLLVVLMVLFATFYIGVEPFARQAALNNLAGGDEEPDASVTAAAQPGQQPGQQPERDKCLVPRDSLAGAVSRPRLRQCVVGTLSPCFVNMGVDGE
uniref:Uncharacterized protein n=1 Tax=Globodera rostochiensis TaxID=31243 RepID=A0A914IF64_GLORO